jgi:hypothetical protein
MSIRTTFILALLILVTAVPAAAQIDLRFDPADTTVEWGDRAALSVWLDDAVTIRSVDVTVSYDTTRVASVDGLQGALFADSGLFIVDGFDEVGTGTWHGYAIVMDAANSVTGPGELFRWNFDAIGGGQTVITAVEAVLYDPDALPIAGVALGTATVDIVNDPSPVPDLMLAGPRLQLRPNPFNPRTRVSFDLAAPRDVELAVFDARGRRVAVLHRGPVAAGPFGVDWDGRGDDGLPRPAGLYLFRLDPRGDADWTPVVTKGMLLE